MSLSSDLISQFVKATKSEKPKRAESTNYGTIVEYDNSKWVKLDGSDQLTPINTTAVVTPGDRVTVMIKDHNATVTGNLSDPSASNNTVVSMGKEISEFEIIVADKISVKELEAQVARIDTLISENVIIKGNLTAAEADIGELRADNVTISGHLSANTAEIENLKATKLEASVADITYATIEHLEATDAKIYNLEGVYGKFEDLTTEQFEATNAAIEDLKVDKLDANEALITYATIADLNAAKADITDLNADVANIDTLIFGSASGDVISSNFANAVIAQLGDAQIKSAMIESIAAGKITAGDIITNNVRVLSEDGSLIISDETIQIKDEERVRVQIGKDASGDYSINIWDAEGNLMFSEGGITDDAIKDAIIRDDMVSENANIAANKLNIESLFTVINEDGSNTLNSSKIFIDADNQTLDIAFKNMTTKVETVEETVNLTQLAVNQNAADMAEIVLKFNTDIENLQTQIDGGITTWFYEVPPTADNEPEVWWETDEMRNTHLGDLYYDTEAGNCYRYMLQNGEYVWQQVSDTDVAKALEDAKAAKDLADQKRRVFYEQPKPPYDQGDLWVQGSNGDILRCQVAKTATQSFAQSDWVLASKYTDDTAADAAMSKANENYADLVIVKETVSSQGTDISVIQGQIGSKIWQQDITTAVTTLEDEITETTNELSTKYSEIEQTIEGISTTVAEHTTTLSEKADTSSVTKVSDKVSELEQSVDGFKTTVSETYATKIDLNETNSNFDKIVSRVDTAETKIDQNTQAIELAATKSYVDTTLEGYYTIDETDAAIKVESDSIKSTVSSTYATKIALDQTQANIDGLEIGGTNLLRGTNTISELGSTSVWSEGTWRNATSGSGTASVINVTDSPNGNIQVGVRLVNTTETGAYTGIAQNDVPVAVGNTYTLSCYAKGTGTLTMQYGSSEYTSNSHDVSHTTSWKKYKFTFTIPTTGGYVSDSKTTNVYFLNKASSTAALQICGMKLERGNRATDWTPAPDDIETRMEAAETAITQTTEQISLMATKTELTNTLKGYYTIDETEAAIKMESDSITSTVRSTYATKNALSQTQSDIDGLEIGGTNLLRGTNTISELGSSSSWSEGTWRNASSGDGTVNIMDVTDSPNGNVQVGVTLINTTEAGSYTGIAQNSVPVAAGNTYTMSCYAKGTGTLTMQYGSSSYTSDSQDVSNVTRWKKYSFTFELSATGGYISDSNTTNVYFVNRMESSTASLQICGLKLEKGNRATDWTPAPEDVDSGINSATSIANAADTLAKNHDDRLVLAESIIEQLNDCISHLVTTDNGQTTKMTQNGDSWTFDITSIEQEIREAMNGVSNLTEQVGNVDDTVSLLQTAVNRLEASSEYVRISTYEDEPCIELGESDTDFSLKITNTRMIFIDSTGDPTYISKDGLYTNTLTVGNEIRQGSWVWAERANGNYGLTYKG